MTLDQQIDGLTARLVALADEDRTVPAAGVVLSLQLASFAIAARHASSAGDIALMLRTLAEKLELEARLLDAPDDGARH